MGSLRADARHPVGGTHGGELRRPPSAGKCRGAPEVSSCQAAVSEEAWSKLGGEDGGIFEDGCMGSIWAHSGPDMGLAGSGGGHTVTGFSKLESSRL
jgi:hypothetical protein